MTSFTGFRRREARAVNSGNLRWSDTGATDADYVAARGLSGEKLGAMLEALKWGGQHRLYGRAVGALADRFEERTGRCVNKRLVHAAVHEWMDENCRKCGGRGTSTNKHDVIIECPKCNGTGQHQHTDFQRAHMASLSVAAWKKHERDYLLILECLRGAVSSHRVGAMRAFGVTQEVEMA